MNPNQHYASIDTSLNTEKPKMEYQRLENKSSK